MKVFTLICVVLLVLVGAGSALAASLTWDPVTTGTDGQPLGLGLEVKGYNVYQCGPGIGTCSLATGTKIGSTVAPVVEFDISSQPTPTTYFVTAYNSVGESTESNRLKVTKPKEPGNLKLK